MFFRWAVGRGDPLYVRQGVEHMASKARNMLVLKTILDIDWNATYDGVPVLATGRYLYFEYITVRVDGLPETDTLPEVTSRFRVATRTTLRDCEAEVRRLLYVQRLKRHATEEVRIGRAMADERGRPWSPFWKTLFIPGGLKVSATAGDAVERLLTAMLGQKVVWRKWRHRRRQQQSCRWR